MEFFMSKCAELFIGREKNRTCLHSIIDVQLAELFQLNLIISLKEIQSTNQMNEIGKKFNPDEINFYIFAALIQFDFQRNLIG